MENNHLKNITINTAVTAAYLFGPVELRNASLNKLDASLQEIADEFNGHIGMVEALAEIALRINHVIACLDPQDFPGVFDYEVSENIGDWWAKYITTNGRAPNNEEVNAQIIERMALFFAQCRDGSEELKRQAQLRKKITQIIAELDKGAPVEMLAWLCEFDRLLWQGYCIHGSDTGMGTDELYGTYGDESPADAVKRYAEKYDLLPAHKV